MSAALIALGAFLPAIVTAITPWAEGWHPAWLVATRVLLGAGVLAGAVALSVLSFTALTLLVGEPFYDRVWRSVETARAGVVPESAYGFWRSLGDAISLILRGVAIALVSIALGFLPLIGAPLAAVVGAAMSGWVLADELTTRALAARGIDARARRALRRANRARVWGFGVATHLCMLVPLGAIVTMPAAVAGSTLLAHELVVSPPAPGSR
jgi:CysZ protein